MTGTTCQGGKIIYIFVCGICFRYLWLQAKKNKTSGTQGNHIFAPNIKLKFTKKIDDNQRVIVRKVNVWVKLSSGWKGAGNMFASSHE